MPNLLVTEFQNLASRSFRFSRFGLNGGPVLKHSGAFSFQVATDDQEETDRYWDAIVGSGG